MSRYAPLRDFIKALELGRNYHISVVFFDRALKARFLLPRHNQIHATPFCDAIKLRPNGVARCMRCRRFATDKARHCGHGYGGYCINGAYEYCHPVFQNNSLVCIIFVGNIIKDRAILLKKSGLKPTDPLLATMDDEMDEDDCRQVAAVLESYILMLWDLEKDVPQEAGINATVAAVKSHIDYYYHLDISLSGLAKLYHYNEKYLGALFKKQLGISFNDYLNKCRLEKACSLLKETRRSVLDIAAASGFNNVTYFNRLFKANYGLTPSQFRRER